MVGLCPTKRGEEGGKGNLLVEGDAYSLNGVVAGANDHDYYLRKTELEAMVLERLHP